MARRGVCFAAVRSGSHAACAAVFHPAQRPCGMMCALETSTPRICELCMLLSSSRTYAECRRGPCHAPHPVVRDSSNAHEPPSSSPAQLSLTDIPRHSFSRPCNDIAVCYRTILSCQPWNRKPLSSGIALAKRCHVVHLGRQSRRNKPVRGRVISRIAGIRPLSDPPTLLLAVD